MSELQIIVFSKDRPAQLELLLRSMKLLWSDWRAQSISVLLAASTAAFGRGYELVAAEHAGVAYIDQNSRPTPFKEQLLELVGNARFTGFLVDDNVFKAEFTLASSEFALLRREPDVAALSLRMAPHMDYSYPADLYAPVPPLDKQRTWRWRGLAGDWGYPMSLDGHIFRTDDVRPLIAAAEFHDPNSLEAALSRTPIEKPRMVCFTRAPIVNIPANRVQDTVRNRHAGGDPAWVNQGFLAGGRLALDPLLGLDGRGPHVPVRLQWEGRHGRARYVDRRHLVFRGLVLVRRLLRATQSFPFASAIRRSLSSRLGKGSQSGDESRGQGRA